MKKICFILMASVIGGFFYFKGQRTTPKTLSYEFDYHYQLDNQKSELSPILKATILGKKLDFRAKGVINLSNKRCALNCTFDTMIQVYDFHLPKIDKNGLLQERILKDLELGAVLEFNSGGFLVNIGLPEKIGSETQHLYLQLLIGFQNYFEKEQYSFLEGEAKVKIIKQTEDHITFSREFLDNKYQENGSIHLRFGGPFLESVIYDLRIKNTIAGKTISTGRSMLTVQRLDINKPIKLKVSDSFVFANYEEVTHLDKTDFHYTVNSNLNKSLDKGFTIKDAFSKHYLDLKNIFNEGGESARDLLNYFDNAKIDFSNYRVLYSALIFSSYDKKQEVLLKLFNQAPDEMKNYLFINWLNLKNLNEEMFSTVVDNFDSELFQEASSVFAGIARNTKDKVLKHRIFSELISNLENKKNIKDSIYALADIGDEKSLNYLLEYFKVTGIESKKIIIASFIDVRGKALTRLKELVKQTNNEELISMVNKID